MKTKKFGQRRNIRTRGWLACILLIMLMTTACQGLPVEFELPWQNTGMPVKKTATPAESDSTNIPGSDEPEVTPTAEGDPDRLIIWLPPEFNPNDESLAGHLLQEKLDSFAQENHIAITVRIKSRTGTGSLTDALTAASLAAATTLPDLIVLSATDLDIATRRELIFAHPRLEEMMSDTDWYPFGRELSKTNGQIRAIPLLSNPLSLVYNQASLLKPSDNWLDIKDNYGYFGFAADDSQAKFLLLLYLAAGGEVMDAQGRAILEEEALIEALTVLKEGQRTLHISNLSIGFQTEDQAWNAFLNRSVDTAVVPVGSVLNHQGETVDQPKAALTSPEITLASGMAWALANPSPNRQELALDLLEELTDTVFMASWTEALGRLPARPSALQAWTEAEMKPALEQIAQATRLYPPEEVVNRLGPALRNATLLILRDAADPIETAKTTIESIK